MYDKYGQENEPNEPSASILEFLVRALESDVPARKHGALWFIANAIGESQDAAHLITQNLRVNFTDALYSVMDSAKIKKEQIAIVMWCLQNVMLQKISPGEN